MNYKISKNGATVTIFVPYDCQNNCPFCINKAEYADTTGFSIDEIIQSFYKLHMMMPSCNVVFTGGEPLADLKALQRLIDTIPVTHKIFINTTLPTGKYNKYEVADFLNRNRHKITCINVSRHLKKYVSETSDDIFNLIKVPFRINCVLYDKFVGDDMKKFVARFRIYDTYIQFRRDYTKTTLENLYDEADDYILRTLKSTFESGRMFHRDTFRCGYEFFVDGYRVTYHKTLPYSTINENGYDILTDIIIRQNGTILSDWNDYGHELDLNNVTEYYNKRG
jgi:organic radical activating enzyme